MYIGLSRFLNFFFFFFFDGLYSTPACLARFLRAAVDSTVGAEEIQTGSSTFSVGGAPHLLLTRWILRVDVEQSLRFFHLTIRPIILLSLSSWKGCCCTVLWVGQATRQPNREPLLHHARRCRSSGVEPGAKPGSKIVCASRRDAMITCQRWSLPSVAARRGEHSAPPRPPRENRPAPGQRQPQQPFFGPPSPSPLGWPPMLRAVSKSLFAGNPLSFRPPNWQNVLIS